MPVPADFYLLRVPHFSITQLFALNKKIEQQDIYGIKTILNNEVFLNAIYLSSRYFFDVAVSWLNNDSILYNAEDKVLISLYKYYSRICTRCTPYGLFAGFGTGTVSDKSSQILLSEKSFSPIFRIDMLFLKKIKEQLLENNTEGIRYYPNNSIYEVSENIRYIEWDREYNYEITEVENNIVLSTVIQISKKGVTKSEIIDHIEQTFSDIEKNEIVEYINSLIDSKILVDSLPPFLTSLDDPLLELNNTLKNIGVNTDILNPIIEFQRQNINNLSSNQYKEITEYCNKIIGDNNGQFYQVDLKANLESNNINKSIVENLSKVALELKSITNNQPHERLTEFYKNFSRKFEGREIPLSKALDPQIGVGYGLQTSGNVEETPLVSDIYFTYKNPNEKVLIPPIIKVVIDKYLDCFNSPFDKVINLSEYDVKAASSGKSVSNLQNDYYIFGDLIAKSVEDLDSLDFKFLPKAPFPSPFANNILSRFAYHDEELTKKMKVNLQRNSNVIQAEVVHHPSDRVGNILLRPNLYDFEIPYVTETKGDKVRIDINDILIKIDGGRIVLKSKSQNKEIKPYLSSAYNYTLNQLAVIRFLGDLQYHSKYNGFNWDWSIFRKRSYLPRVEYKNIILTEARWRIEESKKRPFNEFKDLIIKMSLPRYCNFKEGDNVLLMDLQNDICLSTLYSKSKKAALYLYESFVDDLFISNSKGQYTAEFIFPLYVRNNNDKNIEFNTEKKDTDVKQRDFYPGAEWTYFNIYCSHIFGDKVLQEAIAPFLDNFCKKGIDIKWFYIRYENPDPHIRFRIHYAFSEAIITELNKYLTPLLKDGIIFSIQIDTYKREIERYGEKNIELSEELFYFDSKATLKLISQMIEEGSDENLRWKIGVVSLGIMLDDFGISIKDRVILFENLYTNFLPEFVDNSNNQYVKLFKGSLDKEYRKHRGFLDQILRKKEYDEIKMFVSPYIERSKYVREIVEPIRGNTKNNNELLNLLQSYVHMTLNRLFFTKARMHELIIYYFMFQTYNSILHRNDEK